MEMIEIKMIEIEMRERERERETELLKHWEESRNSHPQSLGCR